MSPSRKKKRVQRAPQSSQAPARNSTRTSNLMTWSLLAVCVPLLLGGLFVAALLWKPSPELQTPRRAKLTAEPVSEVESPQETRYFQRDKLTLVWDGIKPHIRQRLVATADSSNIAPQDYVGAQACQDCHKENFSNWSQHPHRWMNATATRETVMGDFSEQSIRYRGGTARFYRAGDEYRMSFERDDLKREYTISQTIGSRFYQYYVGKGLVGPESPDHDYYHRDFVLPFGYWLDRQAWVPVVHVGEELDEQHRWESLEQLEHPEDLDLVHGGVDKARGVSHSIYDLGLAYSTACNYCHTTFSLGDMMVRNPNLIGQSLTNEFLLEMSDYLAQSRPEFWPGEQNAADFPAKELESLIQNLSGLEAPEHAQTLGIDCEACHLGCRAHAENESVKPSFTPQNPHLLAYAEDGEIAGGRTAANINAICARCHNGNRPTYAAGMATWNSTEYTDAMKGHCYSQLSCAHCHDPHKATGKAWSKSAQEDDASCLSCHQDYSEPGFRGLHTRHSAGSAGDSCMNCHMPKINEGMQDVVRTHTIFSPTENRMLEANHPNACNLCHLDKSIDWTLSYLQTWYGKSYDQSKINAAYPSRTQPVGSGWLASDHEATRLVAAEAFAKQGATWGLSLLLDCLDDEYLMVRQFAQEAVEELGEIKLDQDFGYWFYQTPDERKPALDRIRRSLSTGIPARDASQ
ncbi:MAG: hypothetical protein NXI32_10455 [bacterium]|nr:hypothetical protein [bacterium]